MKTFCLKLLLLLLLIPSFTNAQSVQDSLSRQFLRLNKEGKFDEAVKFFAPAVADKLSSKMLKNVWTTITTKQGDYLKTSQSAFKKIDTITIITEQAEFDKAEITFTFAFNPQNLMVGYRIVNVTPKAKTKYLSDTSSNAIDTTLQTTTGNIAGTIMFTQKRGKAPVVLIIAGSGAVDRNGNAPNGDHSNAYKLLAEALAKNNIASLRYDKRGMGESAGALKDIRNLSLNTLVKDAEGWIKLLKDDKDFSKVIVIGHSQGSLIGMIAAREAKADAYISIAGAGQSIDSILLMQFKNAGISDNDYTFSQQAFQKLKTNKPLDTANVPPSLQTFFKPGIQPFISSWIAYNPQKEIAKLPIPTLIINGTHDLQVPVKQARILAKADPKAQLLIIDSMNHVLKNAPANRQGNLETYMEPDLPLNAQLVNGIVTFINKIDH